LAETFSLSRAPIEKTEFAEVLCYPQPEPHELEARIVELSTLGVDTLELVGTHSIGRVKVLGKGCVGIVIKSRMGRKVVAVKVRRTDANRLDMDHEARMLRLANTVGVGPKLLAQSKNFLVMEFINGIPLHRWVTLLPKSGCKRRVRNVLTRLLDECFSLDQIGLDHGELSEAPKNVLVDGDDRPRIVDFESASNQRRPSNVTSIAQYLLIGGGPARRIRSILGWRRKIALIRALRDYKQHPDLDRLLQIKNVVGL